MKLKFKQIIYQSFNNNDRYVIKIYPGIFNVLADRKDAKEGRKIFIYANGYLKETIEYPSFSDTNNLKNFKKLSFWNDLNKVFKEFNIDPEKYYW